MPRYAGSGVTLSGRADVSSQILRCRLINDNGSSRDPFEVLIVILRGFLKIRKHPDRKRNVWLIGIGPPTISRFSGPV